MALDVSPRGVETAGSRRRAVTRIRRGQRQSSSSEQRECHLLEGLGSPEANSNFPVKLSLGTERC